MLSAVERSIIGYLKEYYWVFKGEVLGMKGEELGMPFFLLNVVENREIAIQRKVNSREERRKKEYV